MGSPGKEKVLGLIYNNLDKLLLIVGLSLFFFGAFKIFSSQNESEVEVIPLENSEKNIVVDVSGAVEKPGVYSLASQSRIKDALISAGGFSSKADKDWVSKNLNLAQVVDDGTKIYIPFDGQEKDTLGQTDENEEKVNINTASASQLETLPGIGPSLAEKIISYREEKGPFQSLQGLMDVSGIGDSLFENIKNDISLW
jgi:competence protein ComEA